MRGRGWHGQILLLRRRARDQNTGHRADGSRLSDSAAEHAQLDVGVAGGNSARQRGLSDLAVRVMENTKRPVKQGFSLFAGVFAFQPRQILKLQSSLDLAAAQAASAHGHALRGAFNDHANLLRVRSPGAARLAVGVADVVAIHDTLAANLTKLSHTLSHLLQGYVTTNNGIIPPSAGKRKGIACKTSGFWPEKFPNVKKDHFFN